MADSVSIILLGAGGFILWWLLWGSFTNPADRAESDLKRKADSGRDVVRHDYEHVPGAVLRADSGDWVITGIDYVWPDGRRFPMMIHITPPAGVAYRRWLMNVDWGEPLPPNDQSVWPESTLNQYRSP